MSRGRPRYGHACVHTRPRYRRWACRALGPGACGRRAAVGTGVGAHRARGAGGSGARARQAQGRAGARLEHAGRPAGLPGRTSWARLGVLVHLTQFLAWFDSV